MSDGIRYTTWPSPIGDLFLAESEKGLVMLEVLHRPAQTAATDLGIALGKPVYRSQTQETDVTRQLDEYFHHGREEFDILLDWHLVSGFTRDALEEICRIPYGHTASYGEIAIAAGAPGAARAAGRACRISPFSIVVPVHRVVRADGSIGEYGGYSEIKKWLLQHEQRAIAT